MCSKLITEIKSTSRRILFASWLKDFENDFKPKQ